MSVFLPSTSEVELRGVFMKALQMPTCHHLNIKLLSQYIHNVQYSGFGRLKNRWVILNLRLTHSWCFIWLTLKTDLLQVVLKLVVHLIPIYFTAIEYGHLLMYWQSVVVWITASHTICIKPLTILIMIQCHHTVTSHIMHVAWASYHIRKIAGCVCAGNVGNVFLVTENR